MAPNSDTKLEGESTCCCKSDMRNLVNFHASTQSFKIGTLMGSFCPKYINA